LLGKYIETLRSLNEIVEIAQDVSPFYQITSLLLEAEPRPALFMSVKGYGDFYVLGNTVSDKRYLALSLGVEQSEIDNFVLNALTDPIEPVAFREEIPPEFKKIGPNILSLPILKHYKEEPSGYITAGIVIARFPRSARENLSFHRMMVIGENRVVARVLPRHLLRIAEEKGGRTSVAIAIGVHPAVMLSAAISPPYGESEYAIANSLLRGGLELFRIGDEGMAVPSHAEIVMTGVLDLRERADEGPFVDLSKTLDEVRNEPVITIHSIYVRERAIYQSITPGGKEHVFLMSYPKEVMLKKHLLDAGICVKGVNMSSGGGAYFRAVVSILKREEFDPKHAILTAFTNIPQLKLVIVVDADVSPFDLEEVEWALATRFQPTEERMVILHGVKGSTLDPSAEKGFITSKIGIDATIPLKADKARFSKVRIPKQNEPVFIS